MGLEFLDLLSIISFAIQIQNTAILQRQATNDDVIEDLHKDVDRLERKLDKLIELMQSR